MESSPVTPVKNGTGTSLGSDQPASQGKANGKNTAHEENGKTGTPKGKAAPGSKDLLFYHNVIMHSKTKIEPDWTKVAEAMGLKTASCASVRFGQIKRKLMADFNLEPAKLFETPSKRKAATAAADGFPKPKKTKKSAKNTKDNSTDEPDGTDDDDAQAAAVDHFDEGFKAIKGEED